MDSERIFLSPGLSCNFRNFPMDYLGLNRGFFKDFSEGQSGYQ